MESLMRRFVGRARAGLSLGQPKMFQALCESGLVGFIVVSEDGRFVDTNAEFVRMIGYTRQELLSMTYRDITFREDLAECERHLGDLRTGRASQVQFEKRFVRKDGGSIWCQLLATTVGRRHARRFAAIAVDRTDRREAEEGILWLNQALEQRVARRSGQLAISRATLLAVLETSLDGILAVDPNGRFLFFNKRFAAMWRLPEDVLSRGSDEEALECVRPFLADPEGFYGRIRHLYAHPEETSFERIALNDGRVFERFSSAIRTPDGAVHGRVWYFRDAAARDSV